MGKSEPCILMHYGVRLSKTLGKFHEETDNHVPHRDA